MGQFSEIILNSRASIEKEDLAVLLPFVAEIEPFRVLEIGVHRGYSLELWRKAFGKDCILAGIEIDTKEFDKTLASNELYLIKRDSHTEEAVVLAKHFFANQSIDFLFIDGDHSYEGVKKDFEMYSPLVKTGGIIAFHDAIYHHDKTEEVDVFWNEIKTQYPYVEIEVGKNSTGIGVIYV